MLLRDRVPLVLQSSETECGVAVLAMVFAYFHVYVDIQELRADCCLSRDGTQVATLVSIARKYGFIAKVLSVEIAELKTLTAPVIAFWNFNHYVVIKRVGKHKAVINDPAQGEVLVNYAQLDLAFTGIIIAISPTNKTVKIKKSVRGRDFFYIKESWLEWRNIFLLLPVVLGFLWIFLRLSPIFPAVAKQGEYSYKVILLGLCVSCLFISIIACQKWRQFTLCEDTSRLKTLVVIEHALKLPLMFFLLQQKNQISVLVHKIAEIVNVKTQLNFDCLVLFLMGVVSIMFMFYLDVFLSLSILGVCCIFFAFCLMGSKSSHVREQASFYAAEKWHTYIASSLRNREVVKACGYEALVFKKWYQLFRQKIFLQDKAYALNVTHQAVGQLGCTLAILFLMSVGEWRVSAGLLSVVNLGAFYMLCLLFFGGIKKWFYVWQAWQKNAAARTKINLLVDHQKDARFVLAKNSLNFCRYQPMLAVREADFYYNQTAKKTLQAISFKVNAGEHVAIVGCTGSGKSTLAKLLCGLYPLHAGDIFLWGKSLASFSADEFSQYFSYVAQESKLFSGTLYQNITLWSKGISQAAIGEAIQNACLEEVIAVRGLHSKVINNGSNFSGGERQRIDIARALLQDTPILILDEATAALDEKQTKKLIHNLRQLKKTVIFVAHRLSSIKHCDQILVLDQGSIIERGNHASLMALAGHYSYLSKMEF